MWSNMKATQEILDNRVLDQHNLDPEELFSERILAIIDEVMEYAKSTKCFKYWSQKDPDPDHVRLEEFVDGIHFYLQWFNFYEIRDEEILFYQANSPATPKGLSKKEIITHHITEALRHLMQLHEPLQDDDHREQLVLVSFSHFWAAGRWDGFDSGIIENAYYLKNKKNHDRQNNGY